MGKDEIELTPSQKHVFEQLKLFCKDKDTHVFILTGYAGTGKTTLLKVFFRWLKTEKKYKNLLDKRDDPNSDGCYVPLATTGRAAKILKDKTGELASTVHSQIYYFKGFNKDIESVADSISKNKGFDNTGELFINFDFFPITHSSPSTVYVVDEASMLTDKETLNATQAVFGTGHVLDDLMNYAPNSKYIFVGDPCQLPPINDNQSPALNPVYMRTHYHVTVKSETLTQIIRQKSGNDIILSAERMRRLCNNPPALKWAQFPMRGYQHIHLLGSQVELVDSYVRQIKTKGYNYATMLSRSNKECGMLSGLIRSQLGFASSLLCPGELLLVTQNNMPTGLMNGDLIKVVSIGNRENRAGLTFLNIQFEGLASEQRFNSLLIEELLYGSNPNISQQQQKNLYIDFYYRERDRGISYNSDRFMGDMRSDPYLNALRTSFGYVLTCHKAQGGEWPLVYVNIPRFMSHAPKKNAYQWLYTAETRASKDLFVVNDFFIK